MDFLEKVKHTSIAIDKYVYKTKLSYSKSFSKIFLKIRFGLSKKISSIPVHLK